MLNAGTASHRFRSWCVFAVMELRTPLATCGPAVRSNSEATSVSAKLRKSLNMLENIDGPHNQLTSSPECSLFATASLICHHSTAMPVYQLISHTLRAAVDAHDDWKLESSRRRIREPEFSLVYTPVYKLATAIERQVNPRRRSSSTQPPATFYPLPLTAAQSQRSTPLLSRRSGVPLSPQSTAPSRAPSHVDTQLHDESDDPPPPYPGPPASTSPSKPTSHSFSSRPGLQRARQFATGTEQVS